VFLLYKANYEEMTIRQTNLFLTAFEILDKEKIPLSQNHHFFP